nr:hypothetical protein [Tanacetum cinerariifolium]
MTENRSYLTDYEEIDGRFVAFGGNSKGGKNTGKCKIRTGKLDFKDVYFVKELKFNLFSVSQMCDKKNSVLFTDTAYVVLSLNFLTDESCVLLKVVFFKEVSLVALQKPHQKNLIFGIRDLDMEEEKKDAEDPKNKDCEVPNTEEPRVNQEKDNVNSTNQVNAVSSTVNVASNEVNIVGRKSSIELPNDPNTPKLEDISIFEDSNEDVFGAEADLNNLESTFQARLVAHGHTQDERIDYAEVFAPVTRIEAIRLFLAYASFKDFVVYQIDVKSAFLYGKIEKEVYVCQPPGFEDPDFLNKVYKVEKELYGLHQAPRACSMGLQVKQKEDGIFISQDKYANEILNKFGFSDVKTTSTPMETHKTLLKDEKGEDVDEHLYRSMIGSSMYLTSSRPNIMFSCKKQNVVANSITKAEYVAASSCCGQATAKVTNINGEAQLHANVDGKKVVIFEASIRRDLWFGDEGGIDCFSNEVIFEQLTLTG